MKIRASVIGSVSAMACIALLLLAGAMAVNAQVSASAGEEAIRINEIMPRPVQGHDWIELYLPGQVSFLYMPMMLQGESGAFKAASVAQAGFQADGQEISGWEIVTAGGVSYVIPDALPPTPPGATVLILYDGLGSEHDDYDFSDYRAVLHTPSGAVDALGDFTDQVALYAGRSHNAETIRDFMAYGGLEGAAAGDALAAGLWPPDVFVGPTVQIPGGEALQDGGSLGVFPGDIQHSPADWVIYEPDHPSPGAPNPPPAPYFRNPPDGIATTDRQIAFGWSNVADAVAYQLQVDDDPQFRSPIIDVETSESSYEPTALLPTGPFHFRARAIFSGRQLSDWSRMGLVTFMAQVQVAAPGISRLLNVTPQLQHKDSRMLCLDGHSETGRFRWDSAHENDGDWNIGNGTPVRGDLHDNWYCTRAAISMIVDYFGGSLSQDRISFMHFGGGPPEGDMGHGQGLWPCHSGSWSGGDCVFGWALNGAAPTSSRGKPTFAQARGWIDANRPILIVENGDRHSVVMDGYNTTGTLAHRVDPWTGAASWISWNSWSVSEYHVPPAAASVRSDEANFATDTDNDHITDWDEINRFHTSPINADSDGDWVQDKQDIRAYIFDNAGNYSTRSSDFDSDGHRKELDADNDGDGSVDGCEDSNYNGKYEPASGETNNFNASSHQACTPIFKILQPTHINPVNAGAYNAPDRILVQVLTQVPPAAPQPTYTTSDFAVQIGGLNSTVVAVYQVADSYMLLVQPAVQPAAAHYDLKVTLQATQNDDETQAVFFLPKLRVDQVLVIDRSGSMSSYGKMDAAKNAARAFIDHANVDDMIGVVSFASSAGPTPDYSLTKISGNTERNAAKAAVNGLSPSGLTALGAGARLGYNEIKAKGETDHDWAMVLLSDGMENIAPYWADATVSGVIIPSQVTVDTVALGYDADETLLSNIATQTQGRAYVAGVDNLPLARAAGVGGMATPPGPNLSPSLPNRLADIYKAIGEGLGHQQRLWERVGEVMKEESFEVPMENGALEAIFAVNWPDPSMPIGMTLRDPKGDMVTAGYPGMTFQDDITHQQYRIRNPMSGVWVVTLQARERSSEYIFILSGRSETGMHLGFGLPPAERRVGSEIPILVVLADSKPIIGAEAWALVQGPNSELRTLLQLFDDGSHTDGKADDGVYGALFDNTATSGPYVVKASGWGRNNEGESFVRHRTGGFQVLPRIAYIWQNDLATAFEYEKLLEGAGFTVDLIHISDVVQAPWRLYSMAVIGPDTGWRDHQDAKNMILEYGAPALGLGDGGYGFFGEVGLDIGSPNGWHGNENRTLAVNPSHQVWHSPAPVSLPRDGTVALYERTGNVGIYMPKPTNDILLIGREPDSEAHYNIIQQEHFLLWGFQAGPPEMTGEGRTLFTNIARYLVDGG